MKELIPIKDWNEGFSGNSQTPQPTGLECPKCGGEMIDIEPNVLLTSYPAKKKIVCGDCKYTDYMNY